MGEMLTGMRGGKSEKVKIFELTTVLSNDGYVLNIPATGFTPKEVYIFNPELLQNNNFPEIILYFEHNIMLYGRNMYFYTDLSLDMSAKSIAEGKGCMLAVHIGADEIGKKVRFMAFG